MCLKNPRLVVFEHSFWLCVSRDLDHFSVFHDTWYIANVQQYLKRMKIGKTKAKEHWNETVCSPDDR